MYKIIRKKINFMKLLLFALSVACMYYEISQTALKLWAIILVILATIFIIITPLLLILHRFNQCIKNKENLR